MAHTRTSKENPPQKVESEEESCAGWFWRSPAAAIRPRHHANKLQMGHCQLQSFGPREATHRGSYVPSMRKGAGHCMPMPNSRRELAGQQWMRTPIWSWPKCACMHTCSLTLSHVPRSGPGMSLKWRAYLWPSTATLVKKHSAPPERVCVSWAKPCTRVFMPTAHAWLRAAGMAAGANRRYKAERRLHERGRGEAQWREADDYLVPLFKPAEG